MQETFPNEAKEPHLDFPEVSSHSQRNMSNFSVKVPKVKGFQMPVFPNQIKDKDFCILYLDLSGRLCRPSEAHIVHSRDPDDVGKLHQL